MQSHIVCRSAVAAAALLALTILPLVPAAAQTQDDAAATLRERIREKVRVRRASTENQIPATPAISAPGNYRFTLQHGGHERAYLVHIPPSYRSEGPTPVLFAFHGGGGNMQLQAGDNYGLIDKADSAGFIAVFPNGYSRFPQGKLATWNAGNCCGAARDEAVDDVGFVRAVFSQLQKRVNVDPERVFATGMSNGGMLSHRLACEMADIFSAIAPVAGTDNTLQCRPVRPISILHIHARDDTHVLFDGGAGQDAFRDKDQVTDFVSVPETIRRWTQRNQCTGPARRVLELPGAYCEAYQACAGGSQVQLCVTETGGHSWPGGSKVRAGQAPPSSAIRANDVMWDFFQRVTQHRQ
jgi:polyhydroxybutyrate depolymerase